MNYTKYGWSEEVHFKGFDNMVEGVNFEWGYGCSGVPTSKTHREQYEHVSKQTDSRVNHVPETSQYIY